MAASFLDTLSSLIITKEDVIEAEEFSKSYLSSIFPDLDLREGVALNDLVIRPTSTLIALIKKGLTVYFTNNSVSGITDETPESDVDRILSNFFITRRTGASSIIKARLYFLAGNRDIYLSTSNSFSIDNVTTFKPVIDEVISHTQLSYDPSRDEWYYDVNLISSSQDDAANVSSGDLIYHTQVDPYFVQAVVLYLVQKSITSETNTEMVTRAETAISTRNLVNTPSVISAIKEEFNYFNKIVPIGMGEPEMFRDLVMVTNPYDVPSQEQLHLGGHADIYVECTLDTKIKQYKVSASGAIFIKAEEVTEEYVAFIARRATVDEQGEEGLTDTVGQSEPYTVAWGGYDMTNQWQPLGDFMDVGLSPKQVIKIQFTNVGATAGLMASIYMERMNGLLALQNYLDDQVTKVICADYLARSLEMLYLTVNIKKVDDVILNETEIATCQTVLQDAIKALQPGQSLVLSSLVKTLVEISGVSNLDVNLGVTYTRYDKRLVANTGTITSFYDPERIQYFVLKEVTSV